MTLAEPASAGRDTPGGTAVRQVGEHARTAPAVLLVGRVTDHCRAGDLARRYLFLLRIERQEQMDIEWH